MDNVSIGSMIDSLYQLRTDRLAIEKQVEELKSKEAACKEEIISALRDGGMEGAKGATATASLSYKIKPNVTDWDALYGFIKDQGILELLQKRITVTLWAAMQEDGIEVPGVEPMAITDLSLTKSKR